MTDLKHRLLDRRVVDAMFSPSGIVLAGAGAAIGLVAGLPVIAAAAIGAVAWVGRVAFAVPKKERGAKIDPFKLGPGWREAAVGALQAKARFDQAVRSMQEGAIKARLTSMGTDIQRSVDEVWRIASHGNQIDGARASLATDVDLARRDLATLQAQRGQGQLNPSLERTMEALESQIATAQRLDRVSAESRDQLRLLDARLDELVARAIELSLGSGGDATGLTADAEDLVKDMERLRVAVEETSRIGPTGPELTLPPPEAPPGPPPLGPG
jgi:uncharacterized protein YqgV (UPF0045/DUF77 family)